MLKSPVSTEDSAVNKRICPHKAEILGKSERSLKGGDGKFWMDPIEPCTFGIHPKGNEKTL